MGHISNPIGFRLTFEKKWNFNFFVKTIYYPEVINTLINLRDYIYYYLTRKKILQSGLSLSHFMLTKHFKKYYIKIFIYHIDLEKTGYDLMNKFYHMYYAIYNEISHKYDKHKTSRQVKLYHYLRDLSNSDVYIYLFVYMLFYKGKKKPPVAYLNNNIYTKNIKMKNYYKLIVYTFFKQFLYYYVNKKKKTCRKVLKIKKIKMQICHWIKFLKLVNKLNKNWTIKNLTTLENNIKIAKLKGLILYKAKKLINWKPFAYYLIKKCNYFKKRVFSVTQQRIIKLAWKITKISLKNKIKKIQQHAKRWNDIQENQLLQNALQQFKLNYKHFFWVGKYKKYKKFIITSKKIKNIKWNKIKKNLRRKIVKLKDILFDEVWNFKLPIILKNRVRPMLLKRKVDPFTLFFYLSKKTGFKKVQNTYTLWKKWTVIFKYMQLFNAYNLLYKDYYFYNINFFFNYIKTAIWHSTRMYKKSKVKFGNFFNLKDFIFSCLQQGIYVTFFRSTLIWLNIFLKLGLSIIHNASSLNKIEFGQMTLFYFFISNNNVTAPFLARYIVLKLKRGFSVVKTLNPLKRELVRVSKKSRNKPYTNYLTTYIYKQDFLAKKSRVLMSCYKQSCNTFYTHFLVKFFNNNNTLIVPNLFLYFFKFKEKIKMRELSFSKIWRFNMLALFKEFIQNKKKKFKYYICKYNILNKKTYIKLYSKWLELSTQSQQLMSLCKLKLKENITMRNGLWLFFLSFFRCYEKKKYRYRYYKKNLKKRILKNYKIYKRLNKSLYVTSQVNKTESAILEARSQINIHNSNFFSIFNLCNNFILYKNKTKIDIYKITFSSFFNKHYINYSMLKTLWNSFNNINLRNERDLYISKYKSLIMGFKMVLKGRFSRKQRASKITLVKGKVPLNTFNMKVDYAFAHITLKNSEISLKFYLYKSLGFEIYKRNLII